MSSAPHDGSPSKDKLGILLVNLGTPDAPTYGACRRFLAEFLQDKRIVELPRALWLPILFGPILTFRPFKSAKAYAKIWEYDEEGKPVSSPLRTITHAQSDALQERIRDGAVVRWAFTYGTPSVQSQLEELSDAGCGRLLVVPMYPHYSGTTRGAVCDHVFDALETLRWQPAIRVMPPYFDDTRYIDALADTVKAELVELDFAPDKIVASYHSIPKSYWDKGDPYPCQCFKTTRLLGEALDEDKEKIITTFQSRVGFNEWVSPFTDKKVEELAREGVKNLVVLAPAFAADCLESLEELEIALKESFIAAGGENFHYVPCLNASDAGMEMLESLVRDDLQGWL